MCGTHWLCSPSSRREQAKGVPMEIRAVIHRAEEGGFWAEVPTIPGCVTEGDTWDELTQNLREAVAGCLDVSPDSVEVGETAYQVLQVAV